MNHRKKTILLTCNSIIALIFLSGCATTAPSAKFENPISLGEQIDPDDVIAVKVDRNAGVSIASYDMDRLSMRIREKIDLERSALGIVNAPRDLSVEVLITKYEKGSAAARAMLAGLGQMHIDSKVVVRDNASSEIIGEFSIDKTFAWGGIYGASTSMEDIELGLAEGIAKAVCGTSK